MANVEGTSIPAMPILSTPTSDVHSLAMKAAEERRKEAEQARLEAVAKASLEAKERALEKSKYEEMQETERRNLARLQGFGGDPQAADTARLEAAARASAADKKTDMQALAETMPGYSSVGDTEPGPRPVRPEMVPDANPENKSAADSAAEIANTPPSRVDEAMEKLRQEEKKGGPNFFDIIEAAAAGWNGRVPAYVQKAAQKAQEQADLERMLTASKLEADAQKLKREEDARKFALEYNLGVEGLDIERAKLGLTSSGIPKMDPMGFVNPGGK